MYRYKKAASSRCYDGVAMSGQPELQSAARTHWVEITTGDLLGVPVEGPYFQSLRAAVKYIRWFCEQIDVQELGRLLWADIVVFHVVASGGEHVWLGVWDDERHVLVPHPRRQPPGSG